MRFFGAWRTDHDRVEAEVEGQRSEPRRGALLHNCTAVVCRGVMINAGTAHHASMDCGAVTKYVVLCVRCKP